MCLTKNAKVCKPLSHGSPALSWDLSLQEIVFQMNKSSWMWLSRQAAKLLLGKAGSRDMFHDHGWLLGIQPWFYWGIQGPASYSTGGICTSPVPVRNTSTTVTAGAVQGCQTGKTFRSGLLSDLKEHTGSFHHTYHLDSKYFISAAAAAGPTWLLL